MADIFATLAARVFAVVVDARGHDGALGAAAMQRSIATGRFRRTTADTSFSQHRLDDTLRATDYPIADFGRAVQLRWLTDRDEPGPGNTQQDPCVCRATFALEVGVLYRPTTPHRRNAGFNTAASGAFQTSADALDDQRRIKTALEFNDLVVGGGINPSIAGIVREGDASIEDLGNGRALSVARFTIYYELGLSETHDP